MKTINLLGMVGILFFGFGLRTACTSQMVLKSQASSKVESRSETDEKNLRARPTGISQAESLYHFVSNSDYVLTGWVTDKKPMGRAKKLERDAKTRSVVPGEPFSISINDLYTGSLYSFQVEKVYYAKPGLENSPNKDNTLENFQIFAPSGSPLEHYLKDHRYLIFLQTQPEQKKFIEEYELDKGEKYYRAFYNERKYLSLVPPIGSRGIVDLADTENQNLIQQIETFCDAFNEPNKTIKLENLRKLADSPDEVIKSNAVYALEVLQGKSSQP